MSYVIIRYNFVKGLPKAVSIDKIKKYDILINGDTSKFIQTSIISENETKVIIKIEVLDTTTM